ncbi:TPA: recombinase family protein [Enterobacter cloacae]|nr:recombinase family protein [Enterobacter cloacae]
MLQHKPRHQSLHLLLYHPLTHRLPAGTVHSLSSYFTRSSSTRGVKLALGASLYDPADPMGKMFFNVPARFAEFEGDLIRLRTREGMPIARAKGKLRGKQPKKTENQQKELCRMLETGQYSINDLAELFSVSLPTVYRRLSRHTLILEIKNT